MLDDFRCEVHGSAYPSRDEFILIVDDFAHPEIPYFDLALLRHEDVLSLDVPVDDARLVQVLQGIA